LALKRELAAAIAIPIVLAILFLLPPLAFDLLVAAVALAALWEFYRLAERSGNPVAKTVGMGAGLVLFAAVLLRFSAPFSVPLSRTSFVRIGEMHVQEGRCVECIAAGLILLVFLAAIASLFGAVPASGALAGSASTVYGVLLIALPATAMCYLRGSSPRAVLFLFLIVWGCDSFAYYTGRSLGRHKLAPSVSPNKTWEGTVGGFLGATLVGAAGGMWLLPELGLFRGAAAGALASSAGQIGDLVESLWKRGAGVKDSGLFLPGHGGFYDRIDSLLFAGPVLAVFVAGSP
jgi:phosphatidate cytidylyltransferase